MLFIGSALRTLKGFSERWSLSRLRGELASEARRDLLDDLSPSERFLARQRLLAAEMLLRSSSDPGAIPNHMEQVVALMREDIKDAEAALANQPATKLDVAHLAVSIQELTLDTLKEMQGHRDTLANLEGRIDANMDQQRKQFQQQAQSMEAARKALETDLNRKLAAHQTHVDSQVRALSSNLQTVESSLGQRLNEQTSRLNGVSVSVAELQREIDSVGKQMSAYHIQLTSELQRACSHLRILAIVVLVLAGSIIWLAVAK